MKKFMVTCEHCGTGLWVICVNDEIHMVREIVDRGKQSIK